MSGFPALRAADMMEDAAVGEDRTSARLNVLCEAPSKMVQNKIELFHISESINSLFS